MGYGSISVVVCRYVRLKIGIGNTFKDVMYKSMIDRNIWKKPYDYMAW